MTTPSDLTIDPSPGHKRAFCNSLIAATILGVTAMAGASAHAAAPAGDFMEMSIEELMAVEVTAPSRKLQSLSRTPAAVSVLTFEEIQRIPARSLPELLRYIPGLSVAQVNASEWAVTARSFNGLFANKLLVMLDGQSIYSPLLSGVSWDMHDIPVELIDRIEVVRGPGGAVWGSNAFNGVINIITRAAGQDEGTHLSALAGTEERRLFARNATAVTGDTHLRTYAERRLHNSTVRPDGRDGGDDYQATRIGMRVDHAIDVNRDLTVSADYIQGEFNRQFREISVEPPYNFRRNDVESTKGAHARVRYVADRGPGGKFEAQASYFWSNRDHPAITEDRHTAELEAHHRYQGWDRHDLVVGGGVRVSRDDIAATDRSAFNPRQQTIHRVNLFAQDEIEIVQDRLWLTVGGKLEHHSDTGFAFQPTVKGLWQATDDLTVWASASRAVRQPSRTEQDFTFGLGVEPPSAAIPFPLLVELRGNQDLKPEEVTTIEAGVRYEATPRVHVDIAGFFSDYSRLIAPDPGEPRWSGGFLTLPVTADNLASAVNYGGELAVGIDASDRLSLDLGYGLSVLQVSADDPETDELISAMEGSTPRHQLFARTNFDVTPELSISGAARYVGALSLDQGISNGPTRSSVDEYFAVDAMVRWRPNDVISFDVVGQNLFGSNHTEFNDFASSQSTETRREQSVHMRFSVTF